MYKVIGYFVLVISSTQKGLLMICRVLLAASIATVCLGSLAHAVPFTGQISIGGYAAAIGSVSVDAAIGLDFTTGALGALSPDNAGAIGNYGAGYGSFAGLNCAGVGNQCGTIKGISSFSSVTPVTRFLAFNTNGGPTITFDLNNISNISRVSGTADTPRAALVLTGSGQFHFSGYEHTSASFSLTAQSGLITSSSATLAATGQSVPQPMSLGLLACSLIGLGLIRHKKRGLIWTRQFRPAHFEQVCINQTLKLVQRDSTLAIDNGHDVADTMISSRATNIKLTKSSELDAIEGIIFATLASSMFWCGIIEVGLHISH